MPRVRSKRWCFTLNNPIPEEKELLQQQIGLLNAAQESKYKLTYLVFGREEVSTPHLQGYLELSSKTSLSTLKSFLSRAHWEKAKGSSKQASEYCKKDGDYEEAGALSVGQGHRSDLQEIKSLIQAGTQEKVIADQYFSKWVVYRRSFTAYRNLLATPRNFKTVVIVLWGTTGVGKTRFVHNQIMDRTFWAPGDWTWFDNYNGQEIVLLDEYRGQYPVSLFLKLLDRYPLSVPIKGGFTNWRPKKIYITSNVNPADWYEDATFRTREAVYRRLSSITFIEKDIYE